MDKQVIGVFDSGLGGLSVVPQILRALPQERVVYFGDTARTPYGSKSPHTIKNFSREIVDFLLKESAKVIVIACNTVSSVALAELEATYPGIPFLGIINPMLDELENCFQAGSLVEGTLLVIGTKATVDSHIYQQELQRRLPGLQVTERACPIFVPLIEEGFRDDPIMDMAIHHYLDDLVEDSSVCGLVLACTHYHLIEERIQKLYPELKIFNPARAQATALAKLLELRPELRAQTATGPNRFYASDLSDGFRAMISAISEDANYLIEFKEF